MKITKPSRKESVWIGKCHTCGAEAEGKTSEMRNIRNGDQREPGRTAEVDCPACGKSNMFFYERTGR